ncbi:hypothetical protein [Sinorhizobium meliloti]|uniref:hypothetical protein n=1 Tax=Rhizobium meliloti TaxID=382 RepID=UPI000B499945|nr:hypothetical protein [Sinorhizobium meliloti]ASQ15021.1 hypothetical protein CDO22_34460 [Sinorhizobium meliloti]MQU83800.1 hypothetical protein [Sinorhizobium meliloti]MQU88792.1 hypothetical protein [Sinorhizobium meliloti]MQV08653.1 hypothetical protein [Sinorhizobium meliloti]
MTKEADASQDAIDAFAIVTSRVMKSLQGFTDDFPKWSEHDQDLKMSTFKPDRSDFPVPDLVHFMMRYVVKWKMSGPEEKVRWTAYGSVDGTPVFLQMRKFGFTIGIEKGRALSPQRVVGQLKAGLKEVEKFLEPYAKHQVENGDVTIANRFYEFEDRYRFFRDLADRAYRRAKTPRRKKQVASAGNPVSACMSDMVAELNRSTRANHEGFYHSTAMIDAYFSALEHRLVLLRAFTGAAFTDGAVLSLLAARWDEKLKLVVPAIETKRLAPILGKMRDIKERIRNPFAHGGNENDRGSLFFHLPRVGAIPANFSGFGRSVRFTVVPIGSHSHVEICRTFDQLDALLETGSLERPHRMIRASIDPSFDATVIKEYADAISGTDEHFEHYLDWWSKEWERHTNMDY